MLGNKQILSLMMAVGLISACEPTPSRQSQQTQLAVVPAQQAPTQTASYSAYAPPPNVPYNPYQQQPLAYNQPYPQTAYVAPQNPAVPQPSVGSFSKVSVGSSAREVLSYYQSHSYLLTSVRSGAGVKPYFLKRMPQDMKSLKVPAKKEAFILTALPLILKVNQEILTLRRQIQNSGCSGAVSNCGDPEIRHIADVYRVKGTIDDLLVKIDVIPVSLALAQSIEESGWGTSRFAREGNALFGQRTWDDSDAGLVPRRRDSGKSHRVRTFDTLLDSVRVYARNINRHKAYADMRQRRAAARRSGGNASAYDLIKGMRNYSTTGSAYIQNITTILDKNNLTQFDRMGFDQSQGQIELVSGY